MQTGIYAILLLSFLFNVTKAQNVKELRPITDFQTNENYIQGLKQKDIDFKNDKEVLYNLLKSINKKETVVFPSEHYYYFKMNYLGKPISGSILLAQHSLDSGYVYLGYTEKYTKDFKLNINNPIAGHGKYSAKDSIYLTKKGDYKYNVTFRDASVDFLFYEPGLLPPAKLKLMPDEEFVCNGMDESGMKHCVVYNREANSLYWILNEDDSILETFTTYSEDIMVGKRTEFAYYNDKENNRKILIGVFIENVLNNNWFDGPFDQLPDVYVALGKLNMKKYVDKVYGFPENKINEFLYYTDGFGRVAINNYTIYSDLREIYTIVESAKSLAKTKNDFYRYITFAHFKMPEKYKEEYFSKEP